MSLVTEAVIRMLTSFSLFNAVSLYCRIQHFRETTRKEENEELYYSNQERTAKDVANLVLNNINMFFQIVVARTQAGKTGCMIAVIEKCFEEKNPLKRINPDNIYVITGLSSTEWQGQTRNRMPFLNGKVYHRNQLKKMSKELKGKKDVLIIIDEVHIACKSKMSIDKMLIELEYKDTNILQNNNINFVEFSATPKAILMNHFKWQKEGKAKLHTMEPGEGYKGPNDLLNGRAFQFKKLDYENKYREQSMQAIKEIQKKIEEMYNSPRFHIIRAPKGDAFATVKERFIEIFGQQNFDFKECHSQSEGNINQIMRNGAPDGTSPNDFPPPTKHTFIFIKENLRCAITIKPKKHVGILYERISTCPNEDVIVQGLAGRACGYDVPDDMIVFTDIQSLIDYEEDWSHYFREEEMLLSSTRSFNDPETYDVDPNYIPQSRRRNENVEYIKHPSLFVNRDAVWKFFAQEEIWKDSMRLERAPRPHVWCKLRYKSLDGYAISSKFLKNGQTKEDLKPRDRITYDKMDTYGVESCISSTDNGSRYLVIPVYENMETPPDKEKYQVRYIKFKN